MSVSPLRSVILSAIHRILRPLVRVMLAHEITLPTAVELLKRVYVEVAERDFCLDVKASTDSRISLITGVHRKDVKRMRDLPDVEANLPSGISLSAQIVAAWISRGEWLDENGLPRALRRHSKQGSNSSFENLVASISQDIRPRSVLDEWLRLGVVEIDQDDQVRLITNAFIPRDGLQEKIAYFGHNLGDHAVAAVDNVLGATKPWFERSVHHDTLTEDQVEQLRSRAVDLGMQMLTKLHTQADGLRRSETDAPDETGNKTTKRFTCGIYFYSADASEQPPEK